jgi:hypothetical protein
VRVCVVCGVVCSGLGINVQYQPATVSVLLGKLHCVGSGQEYEEAASVAAAFCIGAAPFKDTKTLRYTWERVYVYMVWRSKIKMRVRV